jgi:hypothetical protein
MMHFKELLQVQTATGPSVTVGDITVTPRLQAIIVRLPDCHFIWSRPTGVLVEQHGLVKHLPIVDVTRLLQLGLLGFCLAISLLRFVKFPRRKELVS